MDDFEDGPPSVRLRITPNIRDTPWTDLANKRHPDSFSDIGFMQTFTAKLMRVGLLPQGTEDNKCSVALAIQLPGGSYVIAETSLAALRAATDLLYATPAAFMDGD